MKSAITGGRIIVAMILAPATALAMTVATASPAQQQTKVVEGLLVWNHLGTPTQLDNSEAGESVVPVKEVRHPAGVRGRGATSIGDASFLRVSQRGFFGADRTQGTVEIYLQKRMPVSVPFETPLPGVFGIRPYGGQWGPIDAYWSDGYTGHGGLQFEIRDAEGVTHAANDLGWDQVPVRTWVHVMFVWDLHGILGSHDSLRIFRDGKLVATNTDHITSIDVAKKPVEILANHAYGRLGKPALIGDELVVWAVPKHP